MWNVFYTIMGIFGIHLSAWTHSFMTALVTFWNFLVTFGATVTNVTYQGIQYTFSEDAGGDENSGEASQSGNEP